MGSGGSALVDDTPGSELRLQASGLRFSAQQVRSLNSYVDTLYEEDQNGRMSMETEWALESLVQRIVDGAGQKDPRFRCCHLIALHREKKMRSRSLEYLVTLDSLPALNADNQDCRLEEGPAGYGKIRLCGREADTWAEFVTPSGYLCRDKIIERWVELIAQSTRARGGASRALGARAAARARARAYCYLDAASHDGRRGWGERQLAIVEGASWVLVRGGGGGGGGGGGAGAEAKLALCARAGGGSAHAYSTRVPLTHPLALLHYTAAQHDYYAVAMSPPTSMPSERATTWQLWHPALEATLDCHCADASPLGRIAGALNSLVDKMREGCFEGSAQLLSRYLARCALRRRAGRLAARRGPARLCGAEHVAHYLLLVLDDILHTCAGGGAGGGVAGFVYAATRDALARRGRRHCVWAEDAAAVRNCLLYLQRIAVAEDVPMSPSEKLEGALFAKWEASIMQPGPLSTTRPLTAKGPLKYLTRVTKELLVCKNMITYDNQNTFRTNLIQATSQHEHLEELLHVLAIMLDQARDRYLQQHRGPPAPSGGGLAGYRSKKWHKLRECYDQSAASLVDAARRGAGAAGLGAGAAGLGAGGEYSLIQGVLQWLYTGAKEDKKYLGPVLKPFLNDLQITAQENYHFLEDFDSKMYGTQFEGLEEYCLNVHAGAEPCAGLLRAARAAAWARGLVALVDRHRHVDFRLVFPTADGPALSFPLRLPARSERGAGALSLGRRARADAKLRLARRAVLAAFRAALAGPPQLKQIPRHDSTEQILNSVKNGNFWRNTTKPDVIPSNSDAQTVDVPKARRRSRRSRPATSYGFPEISITNQSDVKTLRRKYHTLKSLVYTESVESIREAKERPRSAGSSMRHEDVLSRPSILETLDFINGVKDGLCVEESATSDGEEERGAPAGAGGAPLGTRGGPGGGPGGGLHLCLGDLVATLLRRGKFTALQELCACLGAAADGALLALHRLARAARARSAERDHHTWKLPTVEGTQRYRAKPPDYVSGDEAPQPPPLPRNKELQKRHSTYDPARLQLIETHMRQLELMSSKLSTHDVRNQCTGILNPIHDLKVPKNKFSVKRTKSLGRNFSSRNINPEVATYNLTVGPRSGRGGRGGRGARTNDVATALGGTTGETGLEARRYFQRRSQNVVGDSYRLSRITVD